MPEVVNGAVLVDIGFCKCQLHRFLSTSFIHWSVVAARLQARENPFFIAMGAPELLEYTVGVVGQNDKAILATFALVNMNALGFAINVIDL